MDLIIGRDAETSQLNVSAGTRRYRFFAPDSVPMDVSRRHCIVSVDGDGKVVVRNANAANVTFVNGIEIDQMPVTADDRIELGHSRYFLDLAQVIRTLMPQQQPKVELDISPLQKIWDDYVVQDLGLQRRQKNVSLLASIPMGFTMLGGVVTGLSATMRPYAIVFTGIALAIMAYGIYRRFTDDTPNRRQRLKEDFMLKYVCPNPKCRHFMGNMPYASLRARVECPYCKTAFKPQNPVPKG